MRVFRHHRNEPLFETRHYVAIFLFALAAIYLFSPPRSQQAADSQRALHSMEAPAPQPNPMAPIGVGTMAVGAATLAASRRQ